MIWCISGALFASACMNLWPLSIRKMIEATAIIDADIRKSFIHTQRQTRATPDFKCQHALIIKWSLIIKANLSNCLFESPLVRI